MTEQKKQEIDEMTDEERQNCRTNWQDWLVYGQERGQDTTTAQSIVAYIDSMEA